MICTLCNRMFTPFNTVVRDLNNNVYCPDCATAKFLFQHKTLLIKNFKDALKEETL